MRQDGGASWFETRQYWVQLWTATKLSKQPKEGQGVWESWKREGVLGNSTVHVARNF